MPVTQHTQKLLHTLQKATFRTSTQCSAKMYKLDPGSEMGSLLLKVSGDKRIVYSTVLDACQIHGLYGAKKAFVQKVHSDIKESTIPLSLCVQKALAQEENKPLDFSKTLESQAAESNFPFEKYDAYKSDRTLIVTDKERLEVQHITTKQDIEERLKAYNESNVSIEANSSSTDQSVTARGGANITFDVHSNLTEFIDMEVLNYGTPNADIKPTQIPCGGCGAKLHCQDEALPGYIPSQALVGSKEEDLMAILCQRCYFLKFHNMALNVRVGPSQYIEALNPVKQSNSLAIVVMDVFDAPCGIWPGLPDILGRQRPVIIVGNKVDLLPPDGPDFLQTIEKSFTATLKGTPLWQCNIQHVHLASAKTGYGIENLINFIHDLRDFDSNVFILGCTNAGKSSLFNALLGSDLCQIKAKSLIQKATASPWPGTTLNLLKFPLLNPTGQQFSRRRTRLAAERDELQRQAEMEPSSRYTTKFHMATLKGQIGQTFRYDHMAPAEDKSPAYTISTSAFVKMPTIQTPTAKIYGRETKWCFDTPGTVQPDQLISLLTHEELVKVLPKTIIEPRTYTIHPGMSILLGGIGRLDLVYSQASIRFTVFASLDVPICVVKTVEASAVYREYLGTSVLGVPMGSDERLAVWKPLKPKSISVVGIDKRTSTADVVLSSGGFIALSPARDQVADMRAWTPGGRGVYVRTAPLVPSAVLMKGKLQKNSVASGKHKVYVPKL